MARLLIRHALAALMVCAAVPGLFQPASAQNARSRVITGSYRGRAVKTAIINFSELAAQARIMPPPGPPRAVPNRLFQKRRGPSFDLADLFNPMFEEEADASPSSLEKVNPEPSALKFQAAAPRPGGKAGGRGILAGNPPIASFQSNVDIDHFIPPDTHGAAGPAHWVGTTNDTIRVLSRTGALLSSLTLTQFFNAVGPFFTGPFDEKIIYDPYGGRFIFIAIDGNFAPTPSKSNLMLGVSQTADPTGVWKLYLFNNVPTNDGFYDYPSVGFNKTWFVAGGNVYRNAGGLISNLLVFDKADLYAFGTGKFTLLQDAAPSFTMQPAETYDANDPTLYLIENWNSGLGQMRLSKITGTANAPVLTTGIAFPQMPQNWRIQPDAPQAGSATLIATNDEWRPTHMVFRNNSLWFTHCVGPTTGPSRAAVDWAQITTAGAVIQSGRIEDPTGQEFFFFPSIAVNSADDAVIGMSHSSPRIFAGIVYSVRLHTDLPGTMQPYNTLKDGEGPYSTFAVRWGDYSHTMVDPVDDLTFWTVGEYATALQGAFGSLFGTWVGHVSAIPPALSVQVSPAQVTGGDIADGLVRIRDAQVSDVVVSLTNDNPAAASLVDAVTGAPISSVTVPAGLKSAAFKVQTSDQIVGVQTANITANDGTNTATTSLTIVPFLNGIYFDNGLAWVTSLTTFGSDVVHCKVVLSNPSPEGGTIVDLAVTDPNAASVIPSVTVQGGRVEQDFYVFTNPVSFNTTFLVTGAARGSLVAGPLSILAPFPTLLAFTPRTVVGGNPTTGVVYLSSVAPVNGFTMTLTNSNPAAASVPATMTVGGGKSYGTFSVPTLPVTSNKTVSVTVANADGASAAGSFVVAPTAQVGLSSLVFSPGTVAGGTLLRGIVTLTRPAPAGGASITLSKTDPGAAIGSLPAVFIPAGLQVVSFYVPTNVVVADQNATITATYAGQSKSASVTVRAPYLISITALPTRIRSGTAATGRVFLSGPATQPVTVQLAYTTGASGPAAVVVPAGQTVAAFTVMGQSVQFSTLVTITGTYPAGTSVSTPLIVSP